MLILPDVIPVDEILGRKLSAYINAGGKLLASYQSGLDKDHQKFMISELAVKYLGDAPYSPDFIWPKEHLAKGLADAEHVMYDKGTLVEATDEAQFVQKVIPPVFNRTYEHFCSHLHSPSGRKEVYPGIVETENTAYFIHPIFTTVLDQEQENRRIVHVLHYVPVKKCKNLEIVDDIIPLYNLKITMTEEREVEKIYTIPDKQEVPFVQDGKKLEFTLKEIKGHQMTAVCYKN